MCPRGTLPRRQTMQPLFARCIYRNIIGLAENCCECWLEQKRHPTTGQRRKEWRPKSFCRCLEVMMRDAAVRHRLGSCLFALAFAVLAFPGDFLGGQTVPAAAPGIPSGPCGGSNPPAPASY